MEAESEILQMMIIHRTKINKDEPHINEFLFLLLFSSIEYKCLHLLLLP